MSYHKCHVTFVVQDEYQRTKRKNIQLVTTDTTQMETDADALYTVFNAITEGQILKYTASGEKQFASSPPAGVNVDEGGTATVQLNGVPDKATFKWAMPLKTLFNPDATLDLTDAAVIAFFDEFAVSTGIATLSDGQHVSGVVRGKLDK